MNCDRHGYLDPCALALPDMLPVKLNLIAMQHDDQRVTLPCFVLTYLHASCNSALIRMCKTKFWRRTMTNGWASERRARQAEMIR